MSRMDEARAISYFIDALSDKPLIEAAIREKAYGQAVFHCQQLCEKSAKACLASIKILIAAEHQFSEYFEDFILPETGELNDRFLELMPTIRKLESSYIVSRYSMKTSGNIKRNIYDEQMAVSLFSDSLVFMDLCLKFVENNIGIKLPKEKNELNRYFENKYQDCIEK